MFNIFNVWLYSRLWQPSSRSCWCVCVYFVCVCACVPAYTRDDTFHCLSIPTLHHIKPFVNGIIIWPNLHNTEQIFLINCDGTLFLTKGQLPTVMHRQKTMLIVIIPTTLMNMSSNAAYWRWAPFQFTVQGCERNTSHHITYTALPCSRDGYASTAFTDRTAHILSIQPGITPYRAHAHERY